MEGRGEAEHARGGNARHPRRTREGTASEGKKASSPRPHSIKLYVGVSRLTAGPTPFVTPSYATSPHSSACRAVSFGGPSAKKCAKRGAPSDAAAGGACQCSRLGLWSPVAAVWYASTLRQRTRHYPRVPERARDWAWHASTLRRATRRGVMPAGLIDA